MEALINWDGMASRRERFPVSLAASDHGWFERYKLVPAYANAGTVYYDNAHPTRGSNVKLTVTVPPGVLRARNVAGTFMVRLETTEQVELEQIKSGKHAPYRKLRG